MCGHDRAGAGVVDQHEARVTGADPAIDRLHQLAARGGSRTRQVTGSEFLGSAHVEHISRPPVGFVVPRREGRMVDRADPKAGGDRAGSPRSLVDCLGTDRPKCGVKLACQLQPGEAPALRAAGDDITRLGTPASISDCAPMIPRVRPAHETTTRVSGEATRSAKRWTSSAPGQGTAPGT